MYLIAIDAFIHMCISIKVDFSFMRRIPPILGSRL